VSATYRVRQFIRAASTWLRPVDIGGISNYLPPAALELFQVMPRYDRQHGLSVFRTLREGGHVEPELLAAALLHDVGKTVHQPGASRLGHRVAGVLLRALWPDLLERIGQDRSANWRRPFFVQKHHAAIGAELAREAGCSRKTVELIGHHKDPPVQTDDPLLAALQAADSVN
jgi:putative nucleotidyltransferase with HDIG domain